MLRIESIYHLAPIQEYKADVMRLHVEHIAVALCHVVGSHITIVITFYCNVTTNVIILHFIVMWDPTSQLSLHFIVM
jgi:hypothetical protein